MKTRTSIIKSSILFVMLFTFVISSYSQSSSNFDLKREISMQKPDTEMRNIYLSVQKSSSKIHLQIFAEIKYGSLTIKIFNPKKETVGEFSIESQIATAENKNKGLIKEIVAGKIQKIFNNPTIGKWTIQMTSNGVVGEVKFSSNIISTD